MAKCDICGREFDTENGLNSHIGQTHPGARRREVPCDYCGELHEKRICEIEHRKLNFCDLDCRDGWLSTQGGKDHHSYNRVPVECANCGAEFEQIRSVVEANDNQFCSRGCYNEFRVDTGYYSGENDPRWSRIDIECEWCGDAFTVKKKREDTARFCSLDCMGEWRSENRAGENHPLYGAELPSGEDSPNYNSVTVPCENCGTGLERQPWRLDYNENQFCDQECFAEWRSENIVGEIHPNYQGGHFRYGPGWNDKKRDAVRRRDGYKCVECGLSNAEHIRIRDEQLHVHHIVKSRRYREDSSDGNEMDNLITFCWKHHRKWEQMEGLRPQSAD